MYAGGSVKGDAGTATTGIAGAGGGAFRGDPHAWQKVLPSGFWVAQRGQTSAIAQPRLVVRVVASSRSRLLRLMCDGAAVRAMPQFGQNPDATMCMWQLGHTVSANPMCAASSRSAWCRR